MLQNHLNLYDCSISEEGNGITITSYRIRCDRLEINVAFSWDCNSDLERILLASLYKLLAVLSNGSRLDYRKVYDYKQLNAFIDDNYVKLTPSAKLDSVLEFLYTKSSYEGEPIELKLPNNLESVHMYFANADEWGFYLGTAIHQGLIRQQSVQYPSQGIEAEYEYNLTINGLSRLLKINEGKQSQICFIAMAFSDDMFKIFKEAIGPAIVATGFSPYIVNEVQINSDKTINDAIIAGIKKARFTIADFTYHKCGVYFEAGYALGRGQKVIYSCRQDQLDGTHFDLRNNQLLVWTDSADFKKKLIDKIEAFIKD